jgi:asparagine synthase (glutamine-hydrolysing)
MDLWWRGQNIAIDPGTFTYHAPPPWDNPLAQTAFHNTVGVDDRDQMKRVGKFLWIPWLTGTVNKHLLSPKKMLQYWEGQHNGYESLDVLHRRGILRISDAGWLVLDHLSSSRPHDYRLHWLLNDFEHTWDKKHKHLVLHTPKGVYHLRLGAISRGGSVALLRASSISPRGWQATYGSKKPALSLAFSQKDHEVFFWSLFSPVDASITTYPSGLTVAGNPWEASVRRSRNDDRALIKSVRLRTGNQEDFLSTDHTDFTDE